MNNTGFAPKARNALPQELLQFGVHLIYSEGTKTDPYYVENIKSCIAKKYNIKPNEIQLVLTTGINHIIQ